MLPVETVFKMNITAILSINTKVVNPIKIFISLRIFDIQCVFFSNKPIIKSRTFLIIKSIL